MNRFSDDLIEQIEQGEQRLRLSKAENDELNDFLFGDNGWVVRHDGKQPEIHRDVLADGTYLISQGDEAIAKRAISTSSHKLVRNETIKQMLGKENPAYQSIGMGINDSVFYIGARIFDDEKGVYHDAVVCSDRSIYVDWGHSNEIKETFKLNYRFPLFADVVDYSWSNAGEYGIGAWLGGKKEVSIKDAYELVLERVRSKYWHPDEAVHKHHALSIVAGYFLPVFEMKGRELIYGESGWGKTRLSKIYQLLAFHSVMSADFSDSSIFRIIESVKPTIIIDNFDTLDEDKRKRITHIYDVGCYKKQKAIRSEGKSFRPTGFDVFSNMVLNTITALDEVAENRSNITRTLKTDKPEYEKLEDKAPVWGRVRDMLHVCALQNFKEVQKAYDELKEDRMVSRELERVAPHLTLAKLISQELYEEMLEFYIKENQRRRIKEFKDDWVYLATEVIVNKLKEMDEIELAVKDLVDALAPDLFSPASKDYDHKKHGLAVKLGSEFKTCILFKVRTLHGHSVYRFNRINILQFCRLMDFGDELADQIKQLPLQNDSPNPPASPNSPNPPHSPNQPESEGERGEMGESEGQEVPLSTNSEGGMGGKLLPKAPEVSQSDIDKLIADQEGRDEYDQ